MSRLPFTISNQSLSFYIKGRPYSLTRDNPNYASARAALQTDGDHDAEALVALVDVRQGIVRASAGEIQFLDDQIVWQGQPLHNVWVDKIMDFRAAGEPFDPLFRALNSLMHNPTPAAIERLPIFLERTKLGFLPDGRFIAFKGVTSNYMSAYGGDFRHLIGDKPRMPREDVDADPNATCSTGLHVGAPGYVRSHYSGGSHALVLVAIDCVDVVSVPTDYNGEKMRVCGYEVIDHLDQDYSDELLGRLKTTVRGYDPAPVEINGVSAAHRAVVGDTVRVEGAASISDGEYEVVNVDDKSTARLLVRMRDQDLAPRVWVSNQNVISIVGEDEQDEEDDIPVTVNAGDVVEYNDDYGEDVFGMMINDTEVRDFAGADLIVDGPISQDLVRVVEPGSVTASMVVCLDALVRIEGHAMLRDGFYAVQGHDDGMGHGGQVDPDDVFWEVTFAGDDQDTGVMVPNKTIKTVSFEGEHLFPVRARVGDQIKVVSGFPPAGLYPVVTVHAGSYEVQTLHDGIVSVNDAQVGSITRQA